MIRSFWLPMETVVRGFFFSITDKVMERSAGVQEYINRGMPLANYVQYLKIKKLIATEAARQLTLPSSVPYMWRERDFFTRFHGCKCLSCGTEQYPRQRVCYVCKAKDSFDVIKLSPKKGRVITYTKDYLFPSTNPPHVQTVVELDGGCRVFMMMADADPEKVKRGMEVEMAFRFLHDRSNFYHYGWKCRPVTERSGG
ncbi:MAG: OB-fold domain-containing protein [Pseudomonadota bacterium]